MKLSRALIIRGIRLHSGVVGRLEPLLKKTYIEKDLDARNVSDWIELTEAKSPKTGIVHALRYRWDGIYELVADYRGSGEVTPLW